MSPIQRHVRASGVLSSSPGGKPPRLAALATPPGPFACRTIYDTQMFALVSSTEQIAGQPHIRITYGGGNDEVVSCSVDAVSSRPFPFTIGWPLGPRQLANWPMRCHPVQTATTSLGKHGGPTPLLIYKIGSTRPDCSRRRDSSCRQSDTDKTGRGRPMTRDSWLFAITVAWCVFLLGVITYALYAP